MPEKTEQEDGMMPKKLRQCKVGDDYAYFHGFYQYAEPVEPSIQVGGPPGCQVSYPMAIVEMLDGTVVGLAAWKIKFVVPKGVTDNVH